MYTAEASIDAKVKGVNGWRELLSSVGFRFQKAKSTLPNSVFFPSASETSKERLTIASNHLHAFLGMYFLYSKYRHLRIIVGSDQLLQIIRLKKCQRNKLQFNKTKEKQSK